MRVQCPGVEGRGRGRGAPAAVRVGGRRERAAAREATGALFLPGVDPGLPGCAAVVHTQGWLTCVFRSCLGLGEFMFMFIGAWCVQNNEQIPLPAAAMSPENSCPRSHENHCCFHSPNSTLAFNNLISAEDESAKP